MDQSKHTSFDLAETTTQQKQQEDDLNIQLTSMEKKNRIKSIEKKSKKNEDMQKETKIILLTKETTPTSENTPTRRTKASAARRLSIENPKPTETRPTTPSSNVNPTPTTTIQEPTNETNQQPPSTNVDTTPQTEKTNLQNTNNISPVISPGISPVISAASIQKTTNETPKQTPEIQEKVADDDGKKRKRTETESPGATTRGSAKKQQLDKKGKEPLKKRKRVKNLKIKQRKGRRWIKKERRR
ncbi:hypothetical protein Tco_1533947 [Tanacetum coccineum]